jgi:hypothetical protein
VLTQQVYFLEFGVTDTDSRMDGWILSCSTTLSKSVLVSAATGAFLACARLLGRLFLVFIKLFFVLFFFSSLRACFSS